MSEYNKSVKQLRREVSVLTKNQQQVLKKYYEEAIIGIDEVAKTSRDKSLTQKQAIELRRELKRRVKQLEEKVDKSITGAVDRTILKGINNHKNYIGEIGEKSGLRVGKAFNDLYIQVQENIANDIIKGNLYTDNKSISDRIWGYSKQTEQDIQSIISKAILEKKSAIELADDLETFVKPPARRGSNWGKSYPNLRSKKADYNAIRLARTSINHGYQTATIQGSQLNPFISAIQWQSADIHGRTCELCRSRDGKYFEKDDVPLDHPNGLCTMLPVSIKTTDEVAQEIRDWLDGEPNDKLDSYFDKIKGLDGILAPSKELIEKVTDKQSEVKTPFDMSKREKAEEIMQLPWSKQFTDENIQRIIEYLENADDNILDLLLTNGKKVTRGKYKEKGNGAFFRSSDNKIYMNLKNTNGTDKILGFNGNYHTLFHEMGHSVDYQLVGRNADILSSRGNLGETLKKEFYDFVKKNNLVDITYEDPNKLYQRELRAKRRGLLQAGESLTPQENWDYSKFESWLGAGKSGADARWTGAVRSCISDIVEGITGGEVAGHQAGLWGHGKKYWVDDTGNPSFSRGASRTEREAFAHMFQARVTGGETEEVMKQVFPESYKSVTETLDKVIDRERKKEIKKIMKKAGK